MIDPNNPELFDVDLCKKQVEAQAHPEITAEMLRVDPVSFCRNQLDQMRLYAAMRREGVMK